MSTIPKIGDRVRLLAMDDDPNPIPVGTEGEVWAVPKDVEGSKFYEGQIGVRWDNGRSLFMLIGKDEWEIIGEDG